MLIKEILARTWRPKWACLIRSPSLRRSFQTHVLASVQASASGDPPEGPLEVNVEELLQNYAKDVDESRLSEDELSIHKSHLKALMVRAAFYSHVVPGQGTNFP